MYTPYSRDSSGGLVAEGHYIVDISVNVGSQTLAFATSNDNLGFIDASAINRNAVSYVKVPKHINAIEFSRIQQDALCVAAGRLALTYDMRSPNSPSHTISLSEDVMSVSSGVDGHLLAVGSGVSVCFFDLRNPSKMLGAYADCHSDSVTQVKFNHAHPTILASSGEDGLICSYNTAVGEDEQAVISILNTDCPVRRFGYFGPNNEGIYALSTVETASFWHYPSAQRIGHFPNIRNELSVDYLVDCYSHGNDLHMISGTFDGRGSVASVSPTAVTPIATLDQGHDEMLRAAAPFIDKSTGQLLLVTAGEDGRLAMWSDNSMRNAKRSRDDDSDGLRSIRR